MWCIPPEADGEFVAAMEDVLEVYKRPTDPRRPLVCMDETSKQLIGEIRVPLPAQPGPAGKAARYDCEYVRNGTANLFIAFDPLKGWRQVRATDSRTRRRACTRRSPRPRRGGWLKNWRSITPPSTVRG